MQGLLHRNIYETIIKRLKDYPAVALLGPRQCGKSTLAKIINQEIGNALYLDLESPSDARKLRDPEAFFEINKDQLICLDEIQRLPEIFPALRSIIDRDNRNGRILILGSASRDLIRQSSESLAGRISFLELTPFLHSEVGQDDIDVTRKLWVRGGYPKSFLADDDAVSMQWRKDFIATYLERDIPQLGFKIPAEQLGRFWMMCAHLHGQTLNYSRIGESLGVSHNTVRSYFDILEKTFLVRLLRPYYGNLKKRLVKSPKLFIRDSGLLHALLTIESINELMGHTVFGPSWEGMAIENICAELPDWQAGFYRTSSGAEIDLILERKNRIIGIECKSSSAPVLTRGFWNALSDLGIDNAWIIAPVKEKYPIHKNVNVSPLGICIDELRDLL